MPADLIFDGSLGKTDDDYAQILQFVQRHNRISYSRFDSSILRQVNLFALPEDFDFAALQEALDVIIKTLPAIKRIFAKPITHIKTVSEILPVESVRVINNETVVHASFHSELWEDITKEGLKPRKLLTQDNQDNYAIYENVVFTKAIDMILLFVSKNIRLLKGILYANRDLKFNLLERENHLSYFLAIGKLHTGYVRDYAKYSNVAENCMDKLLFIERVIRARLNSPVYKHCKHHTGGVTLKKTNILRMHKDYHRIYFLLKWFLDARQTETETLGRANTAASDGYSHFCTLLSLFAVGHFNFTFDEDTRVDFLSLNTQASFEGWRLMLETVEAKGIKAIRFTFLKDIPYRVILLPVTDIKAGKAELTLFREKYAAQEYLLAAPFTDQNSPMYLSLFDIESFRRLQQMLLRGMIYSDKTRDVCPFCGQPTIHSGETRECVSCRTEIMSLTCPETEEPYFATKIKNLTPKDASSDSKPKEAIMHFRNITDIGVGAEIVCPKCHRIHS